MRQNKEARVSATVEGVVVEQRGVAEQRGKVMSSGQREAWCPELLAS